MNQNMHTTSGRWKLGFALALLTAILWGILPVALKALLDRMDAFTIIWYRFLISAIFLFIFITHKNRLRTFKGFRSSKIILLIIAGMGLCGNYILYLIGLDHITPSAAAVVIQLGPIFLLMGSIILFRERFVRSQWIGFLILIAGMALFFNNRINEILYSLSYYTVGVLLILGAGIIWAIYSLAQKQMLRSLPSENIMLIIYLMGSLLFFPFSEPLTIFKLDSIGLLLLLFCGLNTLFAYGSFAEALDHWEASRISMVLATMPLITLICMKLCSVLLPGIVTPERLNVISIIGAFLVVGGSAICVGKQVNK